MIDPFLELWFMIDLETARREAKIEITEPLRGYDSGLISDLTAMPEDSESIVQQQFAEDMDINVIMQRFGATRSMPFGSAQGVYGDFTGIYDYHSAIARIEEANEKFMKLPPDVREKFKNDPGELIRFAQDLPEEEFVRMFDETPPPAGDAPAS